MKPFLKHGLMVLFSIFFFGHAVLCAQGWAPEKVARDILVQLSPPFPEGDNNPQFDRITDLENIIVFERFRPASFIILKKDPAGFSLAGYSLRNLFFGPESDRFRQYSLLDAIASAEILDNGRLKGIRTVSNPVGPLVLTQWGQGKYFNYFCPTDAHGPNGHVYVGCVAVAMGQIIRYYGNFNSIDTWHSFVSGHYGTLSAKIGPYDWSTMENTPLTVDLKVSDFLSDMGILLHMSYSGSGSTANSHRTLEAFHELGYNTGVILRKSKFTEESWMEVFYQNLSEYKPILVTGGGHAFVCDGYNMDGLFHFNLGWDGYGDGFYSLSSVMNLPVNEAFTELEPITWPKPPKSIELITSHGESSVAWSYDADRRPLFSRIYVDDTLFLETSDSLFNPDQLVPGIHSVSIASVYSDGESRWIGPLEVFVRGNLLKMQDPVLYSIFLESLGRELPDTKEFLIYEGDLSRITSLEIDQPIVSMEGLGLCNHLKRLVINGFPGPVLNAGPLEDLSHLCILEWTGRLMGQQEVLAGLTRLVELRIRQTSLESLDFLSGYGNLMKFEYSDAPVYNPDPILQLPVLDELVLQGTGLKNAGFVSGMTNLISLNLSKNHLTETSFLSALTNLIQADLSDNEISGLLLTDRLQSLQRLDVSGNMITTLTLTADLNALNYLDLSGNRLCTPGRLFLYTPALVELNVSHNLIRDMGKQRCQNLETLNVSYNQLLTTDWVSLQPRLKNLNLEHNRISDLSGLTRNNQFRQLRFLGLDQNPLSKESFTEGLPLLTGAISVMTRPGDYQPLSPCYVSPGHGSRINGGELELKWFADNSSQECLFDVFVLNCDSLTPILQGLDTCRIVLSQQPAADFSWVVASRTNDSIYYSGVYHVVSTAEWTIPLQEGFEGYRAGEPLSDQSDFWLTTGDSDETDPPAQIVSSDSKTGFNSLELSDNEAVVISMEHLELPYLSVEFSVLIPPGQHAAFQLLNMNGTYIRLVWDETNIGKFYFNDKLFRTFIVDHENWMDYEIMAHARNNSIFIRAGGQLILNQPWMVPEGFICAERMEFSSRWTEDDRDFPENRFLIDDVNITSKIETSGVTASLPLNGTIAVYPNPFEEQINITFPETGRYTVRISDLTGREVFRQTLEANKNSTNSVRLPLLAPGIYTLHPDLPNVSPVRIVKSRSEY